MGSLNLPPPPPGSIAECELIETGLWRLVELRHDMLLLWSHEQQQQQQAGVAGSAPQGQGVATPAPAAGKVMAALATGCGLASAADLCARHAGRLMAASLA